MVGLRMNTDEEGARAQKEAVLILLDGLRDPMAAKDEIRAAIQFIVSPPRPGGIGVSPL